MVIFNLAQLEKLAPGMADVYRSAFGATGANQTLAKYAINATPLRLCHFFAQILEETGGFRATVENLDYSVARLQQVWPSRFRSAAEAQPYAHNPEKLGNYVYGGRLGNDAPGDGFKYRGRGLLQITGKAAYQRYGKEIGVDLVGNPDLAMDSRYCLEIAAAEYAASGYKGKYCNEWADLDNIEAITRAVNGGLTNLEARRTALAACKAIWMPGAAMVAPVAGVQRSFAGDIATRAAATADDFNVGQALLYGRLVSQAYAMFEADPANLTPAPGADFPAAFRLTAWVQMQDFVVEGTGPVFYGFVARSVADPARFVLALRGTQSLTELFDDATSVWRVPFKDYADAGTISYGFGRIYETLRLVESPPSAADVAMLSAAPPRPLTHFGGFAAQVAAHVNGGYAASAAAPAGPARVLDIAGHSLGGALATLFAFDNARQGQLAASALYTFASPMVGDAEFVAAFNAIGLTTWRVVNAPDLVPKLPSAIFGYRHIDRERRYDSAGEVTPDEICLHSIATYLHLLDPSQPLSFGCSLETAVIAPARPPEKAPAFTPPPPVDFQPSPEGEFDPPPENFGAAAAAAPRAVAAAYAPPLQAVAAAAVLRRPSAVGDDLLGLHRTLEARLFAPKPAAAFAALAMTPPEPKDMIVGVGIGAARRDFESVGAAGPGAPVLNVYVAEAMSMEAVKRVLVDSFGMSALASDAQPVNVHYSGHILALSHIHGERPSPCGISVGHFNITAGTQGVLARGLSPERQRRLLMVSNNHVLANVNDCRIGDAIHQPGPRDRPPAPDTQVAALEQWVPIQFGDGTVNYVDCATAWCWPDRVRKDFISPKGGAWSYFNVGGQPVEATTDTQVGKSGRTTQLTYGQITDVKTSISVNYENGRVANFRDQITIVGAESRAFSDGGDSGSLIWTFNEQRSPLGLLFAGGRAYTYANKIEHVMAALKIELFT